MPQTRDVVESIRAALPRVLIALDFDGTLAPIVPDPATSRPVEGTLHALHALTAKGAQLAVITGRDALTVVELGGFEALRGLEVEGLYGAEQWRAGELISPETPEPMVKLGERLPDVVAEHGVDPAVWIEDKRLSLVVHARLAEDPETALDPLREPVTDLGESLGLEIHPGRGIIELRLPGIDKAGALRRVVERYQPAAVLYAGDDIGDLPAFATIAELRAEGLVAWSIAVSSDDAPEVAEAADLALGSPQELAALLAQIGA